MLDCMLLIYEAQQSLPIVLFCSTEKRGHCMQKKARSGMEMGSGEKEDGGQRME